MAHNWSVEFEAGFADAQAAQEYAAWCAAVDAQVPPEEPEFQNPDDPSDEMLCLDFDYPEDDCPLDGDAESALASAGLGTDEDYEHYDDWQNEDYNGMYEGEY